MLLRFDQKFPKGPQEDKGEETFRKNQAVIHNCEEATSLKDLRNIRKIIGFRSYYRIKLGQSCWY